MPTATITVKYVNPAKPGKKQGSVKTPDGQYYGVWADKVASFQQNTIYEVEYEERAGQDGTTWRTIKSFTEKGKAQSGYNGPRRSGNTYRETSVKDAERIFVCGAINAGLSSGRLEFTQTALIETVNILRDVWDATFGQDGAQQEAKH